MRVGLALSSIAHFGVVVVAYLAFASPRLFDPTRPETVAVDIVRADEMTNPETPQSDPPKEKPELPKIDLPKPETAKPEAPQQDAGKERLEQKADKTSEPERPDRAAPSESKTRTAATPESKPDSQPGPNNPPAAPGAGSQPASRSDNPASSSQQTAANPPPSQPDPIAPDTPPQPIYFPMFMNPQNWAMDYDFDAMAERSAGLTRADVEAFREHLDKCWKPPAAVARAPKLKAVLRIALTPEGAMAAEPILVGASASAQGPALVDTARRALMACQPYGFLPAEKYSEWKILELNFTPSGLGG